MLRLNIILFLCGFALFTPPAIAQTMAGEGDTMPHDLTLNNQTGEAQTFESLTGEKGITLVFVRSADWCPYCQEQLIGLQAAADELNDLGYPVVTISYDSVEKLGIFAKKYDIDYTMLSDPASESIRAFGILNEEYAQGSFAYGVPHPAVYIIGIDKTIHAKLTKDGYKERPSIEEITARIEALNQGLPSE